MTDFPAKMRLLAVSIALSTAALCPAPIWAQAAPVNAIAPTTEWRGAHISIIEAGVHDGSPVVLIPGLATPRAVWDATVQQLAGDHHLLIVQVNGFGGDDAGANLSPGLLDGIVSDLDGYMATRDMPASAVIGHSMGGLAAMKFAVAHPERTTRVMIVDSLPFFGVLLRHIPNPTATSVEPTARQMRDMVAANYGRAPDAAAVAAMTQGMAATPDAQAQLRAWAPLADPRVTGQAMYEDMTSDMRAALPDIAAPVTLIVPWQAGGPFSREQTEGFYRLQYAGTPSLSVVMVDAAAHFVMLDQPQVFAQAVTAFLAPR